MLVKTAGLNAIALKGFANGVVQKDFAAEKIGKEMDAMVYLAAKKFTLALSNQVTRL